MKLRRKWNKGKLLYEFCLVVNGAAVTEWFDGCSAPSLTKDLAVKTFKLLPGTYELEPTHY